MKPVKGFQMSDGGFWTFHSLLVVGRQLNIVVSFKTTILTVVRKGSLLCFSSLVSGQNETNIVFTRIWKDSKLTWTDSNKLPLSPSSTCRVTEATGEKLRPPHHRDTFQLINGDPDVCAALLWAPHPLCKTESDHPVKEHFSCKDPTSVGWSPPLMHLYAAKQGNKDETVNMWRVWPVWLVNVLKWW